MFCSIEPHPSDVSKVDFFSNYQQTTSAVWSTFKMARLCKNVYIVAALPYISYNITVLPLISRINPGSSD